MLKTSLFSQKMVSDMKYDERVRKSGFSGYGQRWGILEKRLAEECKFAEKYPNVLMYFNETPKSVQSDTLYLLFHTESPAVYKTYNELYQFAASYVNVKCFTWLSSACSEFHRVYFMPYNLIFPSKMLSSPQSVDENCMAILRPGSFRRVSSFWYRFAGMRNVTKLGMRIDVYGSGWSTTKAAIWKLLGLFSPGVTITRLPWERRNPKKLYSTRVIVENTPYSDYFSEKIIDAIINGFHVIYYSRHILGSDHFLATLPWQKIGNDVFFLECSSEIFDKLKSSLHNSERSHTLVIEKVNEELQA